MMAGRSWKGSKEVMDVTGGGGGGERTNRLGLEIVYAFIMQKPFSAPSL
jgi:hypothetical protein